MRAMICCFRAQHAARAGAQWQRLLALPYQLFHKSLVPGPQQLASSTTAAAVLISQPVSLIPQPVSPACVFELFAFSSKHTQHLAPLQVR
jgi:hypothetical protein